MNRISNYASLGGYRLNEPEVDGRVGERVEELMLDWADDQMKLAEAAEHVLGFTTWADHAAQSVADTMIGHVDDQDARDLAFMRDLRRRVTDRLREEAYEQAEFESKSWPSWRDVLRRRALRSAA